MSSARLVAVTALAMIAFAANSLLCRIALTATAIDAASFTAVRVLAGALTLLALVWARKGAAPVRGNWVSAGALLAYAAGFSFAYLSLTAATGALLLFGAVQATMIGYGLASGERLGGRQVLGLSAALVGLVVLFLPGLEAPPLGGSLLMTLAGVAWGVYSVRGRGSGDAAAETAGNFARAVPLALALSAATLASAHLDAPGVLYAVASGSLASGLGYALWYAVLPSLRVTSAATVQLSVPVIAAIGGVIFLGEAVGLRLAAASFAILGGIGLYLTAKQASSPAKV
jgi:drug/metabolite transporter (DMT)-like permease